MEALTKKRMMEVSDKIQTFLDKLSAEEGVKMTMAGGNFSPDKFTLKISGKLLNEDGSMFTSDSSNEEADRIAKAADISYTTPHFIGSVWKLRCGLSRVDEYKRGNRKYPFICSVYDERKRIKAPTSSFKAGLEVPMPSTATFLLWFTTDVEDDRIVSLTEDTCDSVNDYISGRFFDNPKFDILYDWVTKFQEKKIFGKKVTKSVERISNQVFGLLILANDVNGAIELLKDNI